MSLISRIAGGERRDSLSNPSPELVEALTGGQFGPSYTGRHVTPQNALSLTAVYSCVDLLSRTVGSLPCHLFREVPGGSERVAGTPLADLLEREATDEHAAGDVFELAMAHLLLAGNAYLWKERNRLGQVIALWPIHPRRVRVGRKRLLDGRWLKVFTVTEAIGEPGAQLVDVTEREILHLRGLGVDGLVGLSPIGMARQALGIHAAAEEFQGRFLANNAQPGGYIQTPEHKTLDDEGAKEILSRWNAGHQGLAQAGKVGLLDGGNVFTPLSISLGDQQFIEQMHFGTAQVCNLFRVPHWMLGEATGDSLTYATTEGQSQFFATYSVRPWLSRFERALRRDGDLFVAPDLYPKFSMDAILRADLKTRYEAHAIAIERGIRSRTEIRALEDLPPAQGVPDWGPLPDPSKVLTR